MDKTTPCTYCSLAQARVVEESALSIAFKDAFPVSEGHTLIIPRRHTASFFDLTLQEREDMMNLISRLKHKLQDELNPQGFNVGVNEGFAAGQTVMHMHAFDSSVQRRCARSPWGRTVVIPRQSCFLGQETRRITP